MSVTPFIEKGVPGAFALLGTLLIAWWVVGYTRAPLLPERDLGTEKEATKPAFVPPTPAPRPENAVVPTPVSRQTTPPQPAKHSIPQTTRPRVALAPRLLPGLWPGFRGPYHDNIAPDVALAKAWGAGVPRLLWSQPLGEGYAGPAVRGGRVYVLDYDTASRADTLRCFNLADGAELWRQGYAVDVRRNHGMSRTVPAVENGVVVTLGPKCHLMAVEASGGAVRWKHDLVQEFGATVPEWYAGQCPLIDSNRVIVATGGRAGIVAFDVKTGKVLWKSPNPRGWKMTHASILPITLAGEPTFVYCGDGGVAGVSAKNGKLLWDTTEWVVSTATVPTPVDAGDGKILFCGGYNAGAMLAQVTKNGAKWSVQTLWRTDARTLGSDQQTPIFYRGHFYAVLPGGQLACVDLTGQQKWASGAQMRFGLGPYLIAAGRIFALSDKGTLAMIEASPQGFRPRGQVQLLDGREAWGPMALAGTRLLARDTTRMVCVELGQ